jgi:heme oxygenase
LAPDPAVRSLQPRNAPVALLERLHAETETFHDEADEDAHQLFGRIAVADYWRFLARTYGFVLPVELAILAAPRVGGVLDVRRFHKHHLLRQDLLGLGMRPEEIEQLPRCAVPVLDGPDEALGWAFLIERTTLGHTKLFHHLATVMPGEVAFTSTYLKCYFGAVGEMWRSFGNALDGVSEPSRANTVVEAAKTAFRVLRAWRRNRDFESEPPSDAGMQRSA